MFRRLLGTSRVVRTLSHQPGGKNPVETLRSRLYYQSKKRGILENDILLGGFADSQLGSLSEAELHEYDKIINGAHMEWDLYYFMTGKKDLPPDLSNNPVFDKISAFVRHLNEK